MASRYALKIFNVVAHVQGIAEMISNQFPNAPVSQLSNEVIRTARTALKAWDNNNAHAVTARQMTELKRRADELAEMPELDNGTSAQTLTSMTIALLSDLTTEYRQIPVPRKFEHIRADRLQCLIQLEKELVALHWHLITADGENEDSCKDGYLLSTKGVF